MVSSAAPAVSKNAATVGDYLRIARLDHATKHVFVLPGIALAWLLRGVHSSDLALSVLLGFLCVVCIASANYVINEWLDREFDKHHPTKSTRASVRTDLKARNVYLLWVLFVVVGLTCAAAASTTMLVVACVFAAQGIFYNVKPLRTKDKAYLDVISEAINNPLRLAIGWAMVDPFTLPPVSLMAGYWLGGAFLMAVKRFSEYRQIVASHGLDLLIRYRASFAGYTERALLVSCFVYAMLTIFALAVFLIKYRIEYILTFPFLVALFAQYLNISMFTNSTAQSPEKLFSERRLLAIAAGLGVTFVVFTFVDLPDLEVLTAQRFIVAPW